MSEELEVLKTVAHWLDDLGIPYMVTGSMAVSYYAVPRMTRDIDVVVELSQELSAVAAEDLIISKLDWARHTRSEVQLTDVRNLLASVPELDEAYLQRWTSRLGLDALYREVQA